MNEPIFSLFVLHKENISSIYLFHTSGLLGLWFIISVSVPGRPLWEANSSLTQHILRLPLGYQRPLPTLPPSRIPRELTKLQGFTGFVDRIFRLFTDFGPLQCDQLFLPWMWLFCIVECEFYLIVNCDLICRTYRFFSVECGRSYTCWF